MRLASVSPFAKSVESWPGEADGGEVKLKQRAANFAALQTKGGRREQTRRRHLI